jgi:hypothetical protein
MKFQWATAWDTLPSCKCEMVHVKLRYWTHTVCDGVLMSDLERLQLSVFSNTIQYNSTVRLH